VGNERVVRVGMQPARGPGGARRPRLYEAIVDGELYVVWEIGGGELRAAPARCPHRPQRPVLHLRGVLDGGRLVCAVHGNAYSGITGECLTNLGPDSPGCLRIVSGWREGDTAVLTVPEPAAAGAVGAGEPC
jgi:nitrite reductase/ring-hydroxylating ferredoxin subunit